MEDWDLAPEGHIRRAEELLSKFPPAGEPVTADMERTALAARHSSLALLKMAKQAQARLRMQ